ncbi:hypothetical protein BKA70DRAFT_861318 [Coprinopsis sp. MPI-PUGE-AT-0042]|nr:hypothetical protein BKA70DRAFT_861318 [Coprinopsis sp. MPI-PUGE-AT-0042]
MSGVLLMWPYVTLIRHIFAIMQCKAKTDIFGGHQEVRSLVKWFLCWSSLSGIKEQEGGPGTRIPTTVATSGGSPTIRLLQPWCPTRCSNQFRFQNLQIIGSQLQVSNSNRIRSVSEAILRFLAYHA